MSYKLSLPLEEELGRRLYGAAYEAYRQRPARCRIPGSMVGYEIVRPRLIMGRFRTQDANPTALEKRVERELGKSLVWAWGGGSAAMRITKHYRGEETVLHVCNPTDDFSRRLRALPAMDGPLIIQHTPNKTAFDGIAPHTVHPLLVVAELMASANPRAREAALEIRERYIDI